VRMRRATANDYKRFQKGSGNSSRGHRKHAGAAERIGESSLKTKADQRRFSITCFVPTPTPNDWVFKSWRAYWKIKDAWLKRLHAATIHHYGLGKFGKPIQSATLQIERRGIRELDGDNLVGGMKPIIDGLVHLGYLANDTPDVIIKPDYFQTVVRNKDNQRTLISISEHGRIG